MRIQRVFIASFATCLCVVAQAERIAHVDPGEFKDLPRSIVSELKKRGCKIPQSAPTSRDSVVMGEFARSGQTDWAALCSRGGSSSIIIFWGGNARCEPEIAKGPDTIEQDVSYTDDEGQWITSVERLVRHIRSGYPDGSVLGDANPLKGPAFDHDGIFDSGERVSVIHYCHDGKWFEMPENEGDWH